MDPNTYFDSNDMSKQKNIENKPYRDLIECLMYLMLCTSPEISEAVNLCRAYYQNKPSEELWTVLKRILRYLKGTLDYILYFKDNNHTLIGFAYLDWAVDTTNRKSTSGFMFKVFGSSVCWSTKKQYAIATSSTDEELHSII